MKKKLSVLGMLICSICYSAFSQTNVKEVGSGLSIPGLVDRPINNGQERTLSCIDTLHYPLVKQIRLGPNGNNGFSTFSLWQVDNESVSQTFFNYSGIEITGVQIFGYRSTAVPAAPTAVVRASIYNVDGSNNPTGPSLGSGSVTITSTSPAYYSISFSSPITPTGNYAVVLDLTNSGGIYTSYYSNAAPNQIIDENLTRFRSSDPSLGSNGNWIPMTSITNLGQTVDFEPVVAPIVNYTINTGFSTSATSVCEGTAITYTNTTTPTNILTSRMYNYNVFKQHFGLTTQDSTYVYDMDNANSVIWSGTTTYTHPASGNYDVALYTVGGFWASCIDHSVETIVVNAEENATFSYGSNTFCANGSNPIPTTSVAGTFTASAGLNFIDANTGEIDLATTADGSYNITFTTSGTCSGTSSQDVTITSAPVADFTYASTTFCVAGTDPLPVLTSGASAGVFSSTAGLEIDAATGEIDLATSTPGDYTVTNAIAASGSCAAVSATFDVTINAQPTAVLSGGGFVCEGSSQTVPVTITLTGTGPWDITVLNGSTTVPTTPINTSPFTIDVPELGAGAYTITGVTDAVCSNTGSGTATVAVNPAPTVDGVANQILCNNAPTTTISFTGPVNGTTYDWANSETSIGLAVSGTGNIGSFQATNTGSTAVTATVTVTPTAATCIGAASTFTITVNPNPEVDFTTLPATICIYNDAITLSGATPAGGTYSGTGVTGSSFDPVTAGLGAATITYTVTDANSCIGDATATIEVGECLNISEAVVASNMVLFPNPAVESVTFKFSGGEVEQPEVVILSLDGKVVYQNQFFGSQATIDVSQFARSTYFVRVKSKDMVSTVRLILK